MRRRPKQALLRAIAGIAALSGAACGSSTTSDVTAPTTTRCQASLQSSPTTFGPSGGSGAASVVVSRECAWSATTSAAWIEITSGAAGQGDGSIQFRVLPNVEPVTRRGGILVGDQRVDLNQGAAPCRFELSRSGESFPGDGGIVRVSVATHASCSWTVSSTASWVTLTPGAGTGPGTVEVAAGLNPGPMRTAAVVVAGQILSFTQPAPGGLPPVPPPAPNPPGPPSPPAPPACAIAVSPDERTFTFDGGMGSFAVSTTTGCSWTVSPSASWVTVTSALSGTGAAEVRYAVLPNPLPAGRTATLTVGAATHTVRQGGVGDDDGDGDAVRISGVVSSLSGTCPALRFVVAGTVVTTTAETTIRRGNCSHVANGMEVDVEGRRQSDGVVAASALTLQR